MDIKNILCPTDFSPPSDAALALASSLARDRGAVLHIMHVEGRQPPRRAHLDDHQLARTLPTATEVTFQHHLVEGDPAQEILRFAQNEPIDLVVMGSHGRTGWKHALAGSVAEAVMRQATAPVLTVNASAQQLAESMSRPRVRPD